MGILAYAMIIVCIAERVIIIHVYVCEFVLTGTLKRILTLCRNSLKQTTNNPSSPAGQERLFGVLNTEVISCTSDQRFVSEWVARSSLQTSQKPVGMSSLMRSPAAPSAVTLSRI